MQRQRNQLRRVYSENGEIAENTDALAQFLARRDAENVQSFGNPTAVQRKSYQAGFGEFVLVDPTDGPLTINLPTIKPDDVANQVIVKNHSASTNIITLQPRSGATIDGAATGSIATGRLCTALYAASTTEWVIVSFI